MTVARLGVNKVRVRVEDTEGVEMISALEEEQLLNNKTARKKTDNTMHMGFFIVLKITLLFRMMCY